MNCLVILIPTDKHRQLIVFPIDYTKSAEFVIKIKENLDGNYADYVIIESTVDCPLFVKFRRNTYQEWIKGLQKDVPLIIDSSYPSIERIKVKPTTSTRFRGWATVEVRTQEGG